MSSRRVLVSRVHMQCHYGPQATVYRGKSIHTLSLAHTECCGYTLTGLLSQGRDRERERRLLLRTQSVRPFPCYKTRGCFRLTHFACRAFACVFGGCAFAVKSPTTFQPGKELRPLSLPSVIHSPGTSSPGFGFPSSSGS